MELQVVHDRALQVGHARKGAAPDALLRDQGEEPLDQVEPRSRGRREVQVEARLLRKPSPHPRVLVRRVIVPDQVQVEALVGVAMDDAQEAQKLLMAMPLHASAQDCAGRHVESGKQGCGAMAFVVVGHRASTALLERQAWLGAVEGLDLRLLVDRQNQGFVRRIEIEADHVLDLFDKALVGGELERLDQVRLETVRVPDPLHAGVGQAHRSRYGAHAPVGRARWFLMQGQMEDALDHRGREGLAPRRAGGVLEKSFDALHIAAPAPHRQSARADASRHLCVRIPTKPSTWSNLKPSRHSDFKPSMVPR